ncbi:hypothetical protein DVH24_027522, partial [Malus domestica]
ESFDTTLEDTLDLLTQSTLQFQRSTSSIIQNHSIALTKLEILLSQMPYVPPIPFPGRFVKQKHDEPPIDVLEEIVLDIVFEALPQSSNSIECFSKSMSNSPC